jgi:spore coat protein JB
MTERECLLKELTEQKFAAYEISLFLDTHPNDRKALDTREKYRMRYQELKDQYEEKYGMLDILAQDQDNTWSWIKNPSPWD